MLDSTPSAELWTFQSYDFRPKARKLGFVGCNSRRRSCQNEISGKVDRVDFLRKPLVVRESNWVSANFYAFSSRTLNVGLSRFDFEPRRGRNVVRGTIDGGDFMESLSVDNLGGLGRNNGRIWSINGGSELNSGANRNELLEKVDGEDVPLTFGNLDQGSGSNGGMQFIRGNLERSSEASRKPDMFKLKNYGDGSNLKPRRYRSELSGKIIGGDSLKSLKVGNSEGGDIFEKDRGDRDGLRFSDTEVDGTLGMFGEESSDLLDEVVMEKEGKGFKFEKGNKDTQVKNDCLNETVASKVENSTVNSSVSSSFDFLELKRDLENDQRSRNSEAQDENDLVNSGSSVRRDLESKVVGLRLKSQRQVLRRSNILAKQVISMRSALSLGFVSQLWVDTRSWVVLLVEVRPNMLSGEMERFRLEDICQVGDVVLVQDESVIENEYKMIGLDTLVGYKVITPGRRNVGKVRGYTFNINSGAVELLELDSFGISIIPSSLVSTYGLFVEDVLDVSSDTVVVHEDAASRLQRLTKGFWDSQNVESTKDEQEGYSDVERWPVRSVRRPSRQRKREAADDWELPMDY